MREQMRVLLVEDDHHVASLFSAAMRDGGFDVIHVARASAALAALDTTLDLVMLDLELPDGSGFDLLRSIREESSNQSVPVMIVSGRADADERVRGLSAGADDYLPKPVHLPELMARAGALVRARRRGQAVDRAQIEADRADIERRIEDRAFRPVFQPVIDLESGSIAGMEALTRFDDGTRPDVVFQRAAACGLGTRLEAATIMAALEVVAPLPEPAWLSINVSPELMVEPNTLARLISLSEIPVVLELTEREPVTDYRAVRHALGQMGPQVRLSVDDIGAGFSTLRHLLVLRPDFAKLDLTWIQGIAQDPMRQQLVEGMVHLAEKGDMDVVAEGIEELADLDTVQRLGVRYAQGFLLAEPEPFEAVVGRSNGHSAH